MLPDRVSNPGPLTYESGALPIALRGPAPSSVTLTVTLNKYFKWTSTPQLTRRTTLLNFYSSTDENNSAKLF